MVFNSLTFLVFISIFFPLYFLLKGWKQRWLCLIASYVFYGWWDWRFLGLVLFTTLLDFSLALLIHNSENDRIRKRYMILSVISNLAFLAFFKYFNFFAESFVSFLHLFGITPDWPTLHILLPIGISFYTFQSMSYTIDVYKRELEPERNFFRFATFVSLFPQLVAGPIVRAKQFLPQFQTEKKFNWERFIEGLTQILWGLFKKVAIADTIAPIADQCFASPGSFSSLNLLIGVVIYSFQIYCDFSGYSNIACGLAQVMGFDFPLNFRTPYFSRSFSEFWTRWHISLSSWLRDYLYIPMGGSRHGQANTYRNLMLTMLLGGLWHGASWTFVVWGFLHGFYQVVQRLLSPSCERLMNMLRIPAFVRNGFSILLVYSLTCFAWIFFRAMRFDIAYAYIKGIFAFDGFAFSTVMNQFLVAKAFVLIVILLAAELANIYLTNLRQLALHNPVFRVVSYTMLALLIAFFGTFGSGAFIYFQF